MDTQDTRTAEERQRRHIERLVADHWHLVAATVRRTCSQFSDSEREEIEGVGFLALAVAARDYREDRGTTFKTFAIKRIRWAAFEASLHLRAGVFAHRSLQKWADLTALPVCVTLESRAGGSGRDGTENTQTIADLLPDPKASTDGNLLQASETAQLWQCLDASLPEKHRSLIRSHYRDGLTFREIAQAHGVSHQRISQLHGQALRTLREKLPRTLVN